MKTLIYILTVLTIIGCSNSNDNGKVTETIETDSQSLTDSTIEVEETQTANNEIEQIESSKCSGTISDFLKLNQQDLQTDLFVKIDSIRKIQYPENDQETSIMVDLTAEYLTRFLNDIDADSLTKNQQFEKEYHFNIRR